MISHYFCKLLLHNISFPIIANITLFIMSVLAQMSLKILIPFNCFTSIFTSHFWNNSSWNFHILLWISSFKVNCHWTLNQNHTIFKLFFFFQMFVLIIIKLLGYSWNISNTSISKQFMTLEFSVVTYEDIWVYCCTIYVTSGSIVVPYV